MQCKFLQHGLQIYYSGLVKPCCALTVDQDYSEQNHITKVDLVRWHQSEPIKKLQMVLEQGQWPPQCGRCQQIESQGRGDSIRLSGDQAYADYSGDDITLEIRPGNTCNFACQTCWPQASSRVANYYRKAGISFDPEDLGDWNYEMIAPILHRVRDIIILGGEPFYDKKCLKFLHWLTQQPCQPRMTMFTNGSMIDREFLAQYQNAVTLVFSLDAIGRPAEYIRVGTEWPQVWENFQRCREFDNVELRVNITTSPYNYAYISELVTMLAQDWPAVVSWGIAAQNKNSRFMNESAIPLDQRDGVIDLLRPGRDALETASIEKFQKINAINAITSIMENLKHMPYDPSSHDQFKDFISIMDRTKNMRIQDYCPEVCAYLGISADRLASDSPTFFISDTKDSNP